jgi:hypothetical protein
MGDPAVDVERLSKLSRLGEVLVLSGLAAVGLSFVTPFASNEAGCLDHCAGESSYYVWHPLHNPGALFLAVGVLFSVLSWRSARWRRRPVTWLGAFSGWIGLYVLYRYAPAIIEEMFLYGGPALELHSTRWIILYGWPSLHGGAVLYALGQRARRS